MRFSLLDAISEPGKVQNEDFYFADDTTLLVMDGASGLSPDVSDVVWFVERFSFYLQKSLAEHLPLYHAVNQALEQLRQEATAIGTLGKDTTLLPSASLVIAHLEGELLQMLQLGDCTALLFEEKGVTTLYRQEVEPLDQSVLQAMQKIREQDGRNLSDIVLDPAIRAQLLQNRKKMNRPDGYEILSFSLRPRTEQDVQVFPAKEIQRIVLFTDGFAQISSRFYEEAMPSLSELYRELRLLEEADPHCNTYPRFKKSDDATALAATLQK